MSDQVTESLLLFCEALENAVAVLKQSLKKSGAKVSEDLFNVLAWDASKGPKLGDYEIAYQDHNKPEVFQKAFDMLKQIGASIQQPYTADGFQCFYWLYSEKYQNKIFRKKHPAKQQTGGPTR